jgi:DNA-directed RNA polymerase subunit RPC12/RpoP
MSAKPAKCSKCGGSNIIRYMDGYKCMDCKHTFTLPQHSKDVMIGKVETYVGRSSIQKILARIRDRSIEVIEPKFTYGEGVEYPLLQGIDLSREEVELALEELSGLEIFMREASSNIVLCPTCSSHKLSVQLLCPTCGSYNLEKGSVLEHLLCGYMGFEEDFSRDGRLICPKCRKPLKALGIDYKRQENVYRCIDCKSLQPLPDRRYVCENNHVFEEEEMILKKIYRYKVSPTAKNIIEVLTLDLRPVLIEGIKFGLYPRHPAIVKGKSGVKHEFSIGFWKDAKYIGSPDVAVEIRIHDEEIDEIMVLALYAKMIDVGVKNVILAVSRELNGEARKLAGTYGIKLVESRDLNELIERIKKDLKDIATILKASRTS